MLPRSLRVSRGEKRLPEPAPEEWQVEQLAPLLGQPARALQQHDTVRSAPGERVLPTQQADGNSLPVEDFCRLTHRDGSRELRERLRELPTVEMDVPDRRVGGGETGHDVRRQVDIQAGLGHREPFRELPQLGERPREPVAPEHRRDTRQAKPLP